MERIGFLTVFNYPVSKELNGILKECLGSGIEKVTHYGTEYWIKIVFKNGMSVRFWNANKYYAWFSSCYVFDAGGNVTKIFNDVRPSRSVMNFILKEIDKMKN